MTLWPAIAITIVNVGGAFIWIWLHIDRGVYKARALRAEAQVTKLLVQVNPDGERIDPYRTPAPRPESECKSIMVLDWSAPGPNNPTCPACGDSWEWTDSQSVCDCSKCEVAHYHERCVRKQKGKICGCGWKWIMRARFCGVEPPHDNVVKRPVPGDGRKGIG